MRFFTCKKNTKSHYACNKKVSNNFKRNPKYLLRPKLFRESMLGQHGILGNHGIDYANELKF